jgi:NADPH:quinone reductase-like Zn-dependent oxidoreductase
MRSFCIHGSEGCGTSRILRDTHQEILFGSCHSVGTSLFWSFDLNDRFRKLLLEHPNKVLVRTSAFSLNFRDRADIELRLKSLSSTQSFAIEFGSDFVGTVIDKGAKVNSLEIGQRVIPSSVFPTFRPDGSRGIPCTIASREFLLLPAYALVPIADEMDDLTAAGFTIPYQTAAAMIRRSGFSPNHGPCLVTSVRASTSIALIQILKAKGYEVVGLSRSNSHSDKLKSIGLDFLITYDYQSDDIETEIVRSCKGYGPFSLVFDMFPDLYLPSMISLMAEGGRYVTCGILNQGQMFQESNLKSSHLTTNHLSQIIFKGIHISGSCLGEDCDLLEALNLYSQAAFRVTIDMVFTDTHSHGFLERSFASQLRFGRTIFSFS